VPRDGFKSVTVSEDVYEKLQKLAEENHRSIPETIEHLVDPECRKVAAQ
jgi:predicted CopG family antitoxin